MIVGFFIQILNAMLGFIIGLLPILALPTGVTDGITYIGVYLNSMAWLLPLGNIFAVLSLAITFHVTILVWRLLHLIGGYLRGR